MRRNKLFLIVLLLSYFLCGCWNKTDLNEKAIVSGAGIDRDKEQIQLTVQTIISEEITSGEAGSEKGSDTAKNTMFTTGETLFEAIRNFTLKSGRLTLWSHCEIFVLGNDYAKEGIKEALDFLTRDHETRYRMRILISEQDAQSIIKSNVPFEENTSFGISELLRSSEATSFTHIVDLLSLHEQLLDLKGIAVLPMIEIDEKNSCLQLNGTAVLKHYKLIDKLSSIETRGYLWISDEVDSGIINVTIDNKKNAVEIMESKTKVSISFSKNIPTFNISIGVKASLGEVHDYSGHLSNEYLEKLEAATSEAIKKEVKTAIEKAQDIKTDFIGFSSIVYRKSPSTWKKIESDWENIFPGIEFNTEVEVNIFKTGLKS